MKKKKSILIVEDDAFLRRAYATKFAKSDHEIVEAVDGEEALKKVQEKVPDVILLDLIMPRKNGFEFLKELRKDKTKHVIPVFVVSNLGQESDIKEIEPLGIEKYFIKANTSIREVINSVFNYLEN